MKVIAGYFVRCLLWCFLLAVGLTSIGCSSSSSTDENNNHNNLPDNNPPQDGWSTQTIISKLRPTGIPSDYSFYNQKVVMNDNGDATAIWNEGLSIFGALSDTYQVWTTVYHNGVWGKLQAIGNNQGVDPDVAMNNDNQAMAIWGQRGLVGGGIANETVWISRYLGSSWSAPKRLSAAPVNDFEFYAFDPKVALNNAGQAIAVWLQIDPTYSHSVWGARFDGSAWSAPNLVSSGDRACHEVTVSLDDAGNAIVMWRQETNPPTPTPGATIDNIWVRHWRNSVWEPAKLIGSPDLVNFESAGYIRLVNNPHGDTLATWGEFRLASTALLARTYDPDTNSWGATVPVAPVTNINFNYVRTAIDPNGNASMAWLDESGSSDSIRLALFNGLTQTWSSDQPVETTGSEHNAPTLGMDGENNLWVAWSEDIQPDQARLVARHYLAGSGWEGPEVIVGFGIQQPSIAVNTVGEAILISPRLTLNLSAAEIYESIWAAAFNP